MRDRQRMRGRVATLLACLAAAWPGMAAAAGGADDAKPHVQFVEDLSGSCSGRMAKLILVKNAHPTRKLRVWLDRYHMGQGTGDRSRSDLAPGAEPEALGCSRSTDGPQEWRIVRAQFID